MLFVEDARFFLRAVSGLSPAVFIEYDLLEQFIFVSPCSVAAGATFIVFVFVILMIFSSLTKIIAEFV